MWAFPATGVGTFGPSILLYRRPTGSPFVHDIATGDCGCQSTPPAAGGLLLPLLLWLRRR